MAKVDIIVGQDWIGRRNVPVFLVDSPVAMLENENDRPRKNDWLHLKILIDL